MSYPVNFFNELVERRREILDTKDEKERLNFRLSRLSSGDYISVKDRMENSVFSDSFFDEESEKNGEVVKRSSPKGGDKSSRGSSPKGSVSLSRRSSINTCDLSSSGGSSPGRKDLKTLIKELSVIGNSIKEQNLVDKRHYRCRKYYYFAFLLGGMSFVGVNIYRVVMC